MKIDKKKGILFWITGLSGSGKSEIAQYTIDSIRKKYGPTIIMSGDDLREITGYFKYTKKDRKNFAKTKLKFYKFITDQKINLLFSTISMFEEVRKLNKKNIKNYIEIYVRSDVKQIIKQNKKPLYKKKNEKIWGIGIKPEYPKKPTIVINNDFSKSTKTLAKELVTKIDKIALPNF